MQIHPSECQLSIEWTLPICVRSTEPVIGQTLTHVHDLDAKLSIAYWEVEDRDYEWEVRDAEIDGITVTAQTDPAMWAIVKRAVEFHGGKIHEHVNELIRCDVSEAA